MTNKNFDEFMEEIRRLFPEDRYECFIKTYGSTNMEKEGLVIHEKESQISPSYNLRFIKEELSRGISPKEVAQKIQLSYESNTKEFRIPEITKEFILQNCYIAVVNKEKNKTLLENAYYETAEDLAFIVRCQAINGIATFVVNNALCDKFEISQEELFKIAKQNTAHMQYTMRTLIDVVRTSLIENNIPEDIIQFLINDEVLNRIYVLQNEIKIDGAGAIAIPEVMQKVYDLTKENFYIIPSSRHEVLIFPDSLGMTIEEMQNMVQEANQEAVEETDFLANSVYHYDMQTKELHMAGTSMEWQLDNRDME